MRGRDLALLLGAAGAGLWLAKQIRRNVTAYSFVGKTVLITGGSRGLRWPGRSATVSWFFRF